MEFPFKAFAANMEIRIRSGQSEAVVEGHQIMLVPIYVRGFTNGDSVPHNAPSQDIG